MWKTFLWFEKKLSYCTYGFSLKQLFWLDASQNKFKLQKNPLKCKKWMVAHSKNISLNQAEIRKANKRKLLYHYAN